MIKRVVFLLWGLFLFGLGIVLTIKSNLGTGPWDVLHLGITNYVSLTLGQVSQLAGIIIIAVSWVLGVKPGWGTIANMYFIGFWIDVFMKSSWIPTPGYWPHQMLMLLAGVWIIGWGSFFYLSSAFGAGPRDSLMVALIHKMGWPVWKVRTILETSAAFTGFLLGGPAGVGTVVVAVTLGPSIQWAFGLMGKRAQDIQHDPLVFWSKTKVSEEIN